MNDEQAIESIEHYAYAGGANPARQVARMTPVDVADNMLRDNWIVPGFEPPQHESDRERLEKLAEAVIAEAAVASMIAELDPEAAEVLVLIKFDMAEARIDNAHHISIAGDSDEPFRRLNREEIRDLGRWIKEAVMTVEHGPAVKPDVQANADSVSYATRLDAELTLLGLEVHEWPRTDQQWSEVAQRMFRDGLTPEQAIAIVHGMDTDPLGDPMGVPRHDADDFSPR